MQVSDRVSGIFLVALGGVAAVAGAQLPPVPGQPVGPNVFPTVVGIGLCLTGALIALGIGQTFEDNSVVEVDPDDPTSRKPAAKPGWMYGLRALIPPALLLFYAFASERLGFMPTAFIIAFITSVALGAKLRLALGVSVFFPIFVYLVFDKLLRVPLPAGLLPMPW